MDKAKKICFILPSNACGGAEYVVQRMASYWINRGHHVCVLLFVSHEQSVLQFDLAVRVELLNAPKRNGFSLRRIMQCCKTLWRIRQFIGDWKPNLIISNQARCDMYTMLACAGFPSMVYIYVHNDPRFVDLGTLYRCAQFLLYRFADGLAVLNEEIKYNWANRLIREQRICVVQNPLGPMPPETGGRPNCSERPELTKIPYFCLVGRLHPVKQSDHAIMALDILRQNGVVVGLVVLGDGPDRDELTHLVQQSGLADVVWMPGFVSNPYDWMRYSVGVVLTSRSEGFGNVLIESMACGIAPISYDCPSGPRYIIHQNIDGLLVPPNDVQALAQAMRLLLENPSLRLRMGEQARVSATRYEIAMVMKFWDSILREL